MSRRAWTPQVGRLQDLHEQHQEWLRQGYDGHNRKPRGTDPEDLRNRSRRRRKNRQLTALVENWQSIKRAARQRGGRP